MTRGPCGPEHTPAARASLGKCPRPARATAVTPCSVQLSKEAPLVPEGGQGHAYYPPPAGPGLHASLAVASPQILFSGKHHSQLRGFGGTDPLPGSRIGAEGLRAYGTSAPWEEWQVQG